MAICLCQASHLGMFNASYHWLLLGDSHTSTARMQLDKLNIGMNSEITLALPRSSSAATDRDDDDHDELQRRYDVYDIW